MSKKELSTILSIIKENKLALAELKTLIMEVSKKSDALFDGAGTKKPVGGSGRRPKAQTKTPEERKYTNILTFFKSFYPENPKKFDKLWAKGEKKKVLDSNKDLWKEKKGADRAKAQINILYKNLSDDSKAELKRIKTAALEEYNTKNKEAEDHEEEDANSESDNEEEDDSDAEPSKKNKN